MDRYEAIIASVPALARKLKEAGVDEWLEQQRKVEVDGRTLFVLGDRFASKAEAMLTFAAERHLVADEDLRKASAAQPLPSDIEGVQIDFHEGDK